MAEHCNETNGRPVKVAILGSGLAGMTLGYMLSSTGSREGATSQLNGAGEQHIKLTVYEKSPTIGMDAASISVTCPCADCTGNTESTHEHIEGRIDVPMRGFYPGYYPSVVKLYNHAGIPFKACDNTLSFSEYCRKPKGHATQPFFSTSFLTLKSYMLTYPRAHLPHLESYMDIVNPKFYWKVLAHIYRTGQIVWSWLRLGWQAKDLLESGSLAYTDGVIGNFLRKHGYSRTFIEDIFIPSMASVCTCSYEDMEQYPAKVILDFVARGWRPRQDTLASGLLFYENGSQFCLVSCGINTVCKTLTKQITDFRLNTAVTAVYRNPDSGGRRLVVEDTSGNRESYDHVVFAAQANHAVRILQANSLAAAISPATREIMKQLETVKYISSRVVCHSDERLVPARKRDWRVMNFVKVPPEEQQSTDSPQSKDQSLCPARPLGQSIMASHYLNSTQSGLGTTTPFFQTWNPLIEPRKDKTLSSSWFERAIVTQESLAAMDRLDQMQGRDGLWFVGSYIFPGIPLLEGCVQSAYRVAKGIGQDSAVGVSVPWLEDAQTGCGTKLDHSGKFENSQAPLKAPRGSTKTSIQNAVEDPKQHPMSHRYFSSFSDHTNVSSGSQNGDVDPVTRRKTSSASHGNDRCHDDLSRKDLSIRLRTSLGKSALAAA